MSATREHRNARCEDHQRRAEGNEASDAPDPGVRTLLRVPSDVPAEQAALYVRYVRALALLCECAGAVDEPDYVELLEAMLLDAQANYPLVVRRDGDRWQIAPAM